LNFAVLQLASEVIEQDRRLPLLALFGHSVISKLGLLSGVRRKSDFELAKGGFWRKGFLITLTFKQVDVVLLQQLAQEVACRVATASCSPLWSNFSKA